jgi:site-specific DNA-methyltransferase (adenine-specific)
MAGMKSNFQTNCVYNSDCIAGMKNIPAQSVDLVITDPPFGIEFKAKRENYNRKGSRVLEGYNEVHENDYLAFTRNWMSEVKRVLKESGSMYVFKDSLK